MELVKNVLIEIVDSVIKIWGLAQIVSKVFI